MTINREVHFAEPIIDSREFQRVNRGTETYEGWTNSATWCFHLYFTQSQHWIQQLRGLVRKDGKINPTRLVRLVRWAQRIDNPDLNCMVDDWCEGHINVREFVEAFFDDYAGGIDFQGIDG
jgi:hypothetical protein